MITKVTDKFYIDFNDISFVYKKGIDIDIFLRKSKVTDESQVIKLSSWKKEGKEFLCMINDSAFLHSMKDK